MSWWDSRLDSAYGPLFQWPSWPSWHSVGIKFCLWSQRWLAFWLSRFMSLDRSSWSAFWRGIVLVGCLGLAARVELGYQLYFLAWQMPTGELALGELEAAMRTWPLDLNLQQGPAMGVLMIEPRIADPVGYMVLASALTRDPDNMDFLIGLGRVLDHMGDHAQGAIAMARACALAPNLSPCQVGGPVPPAAQNPDRIGAMR